MVFIETPANRECAWEGESDVNDLGKGCVS
jgi:hypothetical protein